MISDPKYLLGLENDILENLLITQSVVKEIFKLAKTYVNQPGVKITEPSYSDNYGSFHFMVSGTKFDGTIEVGIGRGKYVYNLNGVMHFLSESPYKDELGRVPYSDLEFTEPEEMFKVWKGAWKKAINEGSEKQ